MQSFNELLALASKQTEASQAALAKENQLRQAREQARRLEEERKEKERIRLEKERLAKQKMEDEKREQQLAEERRKRQAERLAAVETKKEETARLVHNSRNPRQHSSPRNRPNGRPSSATPVSTTAVLDPEEQRRIEREEKQARAKARLFGEPVSAHKKPSAKSSSSSRHSALRKPVSSLGFSQSPSASSSSSTARQRIQQQFSVNDRQPLNQTKRDRRTIEEVERDMRQKKAVPGDLLQASGSHSQRSNEVVTLTSRTVPPRPSLSLKPSAPSSQSGLNTPKSGSASGQTLKRRPSSSPATSQPPKRAHHDQVSLKKTVKATASLPDRSGPTSRSNGQGLRHDGSNESYDSYSEAETDYEGAPAREASVVPGALRDEIWKIMGKDRQKYASRTVVSDDESSDNMEADAVDVLEEEGRAARLARLEDQREQEALRRHEMEKKKRLAASRAPK